jgi:mTERF domain-containing protein, mitochondrial
MLRRSHLRSGAFLTLLLGRSGPVTTAAAAAALPTPLPPLRHFIERLLGGAGAFSSVAAADAAGATCDSLTLHFLRHSCGLEEPEAAAVAARLRLRSTKNAHAVLALLRDLGLAPVTIARLVAAFPSVLTSTTIGAKLDFYRHELGLSDAEICRMLLGSPSRIVSCGLDTRLRSNHRILKDLLGSDANVRAAIKQSMDLIVENLQLVLLPKLKVLRDLGATEDVLSKLVIRHPKALVHRVSRFDDGLAAMKDLGVSPSSGIFPYAFGVFTKMYQSKWDRRMQNFLSLGWTEEQVRKAFVRHPYCMSVSEDKVRQLMTFFVEKLGWTPEYVSACPTALSFSYEKRVLPRCTVLSLLALRCVIKPGIKMSRLMMSEKKFVQRYITTYQEVIPQVLESYYGARTTSAVK